MARVFLKDRQSQPQVQSPVKTGRVYLKDRKAQVQKPQIQQYQPTQEENEAKDFLAKPWYKQIFTKQVAREVPQALADVTVGNIARLGVSAAQTPFDVANGSFDNKTFKIPGLTPFRTFQSQIGKTQQDVIEGKKGLGSLAWDVAQVPLAGLDAWGTGKGINKGVSAFKTAPTFAQGIKSAVPEVVDAFIPTTRGIKKPTGAVKIGNINNFKTQPQKTVNPLIQEARKYKSAEEFIKAQTPQYHGTSANFNKFDIEKTGTIKKGDWGKGVYLDDFKDNAVNYAEEASKKTGGKSRVIETYISPDAKVFRYNYKPGQSIDEGLAQRMKDNGYDAVQIYYPDEKMVSETIVMNPDVLKTKQDLVDIYNQSKNIKYENKSSNRNILGRNDSPSVSNRGNSNLYNSGGSFGNPEITTPFTSDGNQAKSQLIDIWNKSQPLQEGDPLIQEARKYKSAEEFENAMLLDRGKFDTYSVDYIGDVSNHLKKYKQLNTDGIEPISWLDENPVVLESKLDDVLKRNPEMLKSLGKKENNLSISDFLSRKSVKEKLKIVSGEKFTELYENKLNYNPQKLREIGKFDELSKEAKKLKASGLSEIEAQKKVFTDIWNKSQPLQEGVKVSEELGTGPKQGLNKFYPNFLRSGERSIENQGSAGKEMLNLMESQRISGDLQAGKWKALVNQFTGQLNDAQKSNLTDVLEGKAKPIDETVGTSSKVMRNLLDKIQGEAVSSGLNTGKLENYFPRKYNWSEMIKSNRKDQIYQHMVDTGQASTKAEAEQFFKDFIIKNSQRKAGNLEYERMLDVPGYEKDPEKALTMYAEAAAKRISEVKYFGKKDENISALINKISDEGGDYKSTQKIFDYVYKGEDKNALSRALLGYNAFTKLSLAFFSNLTQSANTVAKGGLLNTLKGASQALAQGIRATKGKSYDDIAMLSNAFDEHITLQETGLSNKFMKGAMYLFQKVENFNRRTAANTGVLRARDLANVFKNDPNSSFAVRQLESLGIKVEDIVKGKLTEQQLLTAANKMAKITQFKANALMMPQAWRTPLGKVLTQFKGFSFMQTKFLRDEVIKEAAQGNLAPLLRFIVIAPVASYVTQSARNWVNQSKNDTDFRKLDLYRKAMGDLPSDLVSQMQYANEKKDKWYTTPLVNVKNFSSPVIGPTGGDIMQLMSALEQKGNIQNKNETWYAKHPLAQSDPNLDLKRFAVQKIPFIGRNLNNTTFGYKPTEAQNARDLAKQAIESNNEEQFNQALKKDPYLKSQDAIRAVIDKKIVDMNQTELKFYNKMKQMEKEKKLNPFYTN